QPLLVEPPGLPPLRVERRLNREGEAEHGGALDLRLARHLEVLDAVSPSAQVTPAPRFERSIHALPRREHTLDRGVTDGVHGHLEAGEMRATEELSQRVVFDVRRARLLPIDVRSRDVRRTRADRAIDRPIAAD